MIIITLNLHGVVELDRYIGGGDVNVRTVARKVRAAMRHIPWIRREGVEVELTEHDHDTKLVSELRGCDAGMSTFSTIQVEAIIVRYLQSRRWRRRRIL